jgi:Threonine dehydratase
MSPGSRPAAKIARIRGNGAQLVIAGDTYADALAASQEWAAGSGAMAVHAFDQAETILGAGTLAAELAGRRRRPSPCWPASAAAASWRE